jgi:hypothetical protein|tara:strand:- start:4615 stop:5142 length:528 start_codon:yes stop_codon:yes gene_type:complete
MSSSVAIKVFDAIEIHRQTGWEDLEPQKKNFAFEYIQSYDHMEAAEKCGLSRKQGLSLLRDPLISAFLGDLLEETRAKTNITEDFVATMWMSILPMLMGKEDVPMVSAQGQEFLAKKFFPSETIAALREISKSTKFYEDGSGQGGIHIDARQLFLKSDITEEEAVEGYFELVNGG